MTNRRFRIPCRSWGKNDLVPVVDVTYSSDVSDGELQRLAELLPDLIAEAVDCPDEPWTGPGVYDSDAGSSRAAYLVVA